LEVVLSWIRFDIPWSKAFKRLGDLILISTCAYVNLTRESNHYCSNCILRPKEEQTQRFREMLEGLR
jgi:hypothetical protein